MKVTLILSLVLMALFFLLLWAAVALVQSKKLFGTAPKDIINLGLTGKNSL